jgi:hypothetical protein
MFLVLNLRKKSQIADQATFLMLSFTLGITAFFSLLLSPFFTELNPPD